jgi:hypothetical protein
MDKFVFWLAALMFLVALALPTTARAAAGDQAAIHGVLLNATGQPAEGNPMAIKTSDGQTVRLGGTKEGGSFGLEGIAPGNYEILALGPDGKTPLVSQKVTLTAGQNARVEMRLTPQAPAAKTAAVAASQAPAAKTAAVAAKTVAAPVAPAAIAGSTDSEGTGFVSMSVLAGFATLAVCVAGAIFFKRRRRPQVSGYGE